MGEIYTDLSSDFPLKVTTMNRVQDVTLSAKPYVDLYNQYYSQGDLDNANKVINDHPELLTMMLNMNLVNQIIDEIKATQRTFKDDVESYIFTIVKIKGEFSKSTKYIKYNIVYFENLPYMAIADDIPIGTLPTNITYWYPLAIKGEQGESGLGLTPRGAWNDSTQYYKDDMVAYNNILWGALADNINYIPNESSSMWLKLLSFSSEFLTYDNTQSELVATTLQGAIDEVYSTLKQNIQNVSDSIPTSLPANGGNADTVDGVHAWQMQTLSNEGGTHGMTHLLTCQYTNAEGMFRFKIPDHQVIVNKADYAASAGSANSATNATNASYATNANYATSASNADTVDGYHVSKGINAGEFGVRVAQISNVDIGVGAGLSTGELYIVYE